MNRVFHDHLEIHSCLYQQHFDLFQESGGSRVVLTKDVGETLTRATLRQA
jgi:hypothetical protein